MTKLRFWDRIWSALMGIMCFVLAAAVALYTIGLLHAEQVKSILALLPAGGWQRWIILGACTLVLVLLGVRGIGMLFRRRREKGFVVQHTEYGDMSISMKAMENMVKKCVESHGELTANYTRIYLVRNGVSIDMKITLASGVNIPLTVSALQKQIKQYITSCSGVDVHEVLVKVETDTVKLLPPPETPAAEPAPVKVIESVQFPSEPVKQPVEEPVYSAPVPEQEEIRGEQQEAVPAFEELAQEEVTETAETAAEEPAAEEPAAESEEAKIDA